VIPDDTVGIHIISEMAEDVSVTLKCKYTHNWLLFQNSIITELVYLNLKYRIVKVRK